MRNKEFDVRKLAAQNLIKLKQLAPGSDEYNKLAAFTTINPFELQKLGQQAIPALEAMLDDDNPLLRIDAAEILLLIGEKEAGIKAFREIYPTASRFEKQRIRRLLKKHGEKL